MARDAHSDIAVPGRRTSLWMCSALHGLNHSFMVALPPLYIQMQKEFGFSTITPIMALGTAYIISYAICNLPFGFLADRFSKRYILAGGSLLNGLGLAACAFVPSYGVLAIMMVVAGIGGGSYHPAANALVTHLFPRDKGRALGMTGVGSSFGLMCGPLMGGLLGSLFGWRVTCLSLGVAGVIFSIVFFYLVAEPQRTARVRRTSSLIPLVGFFVVAALLFGLRDITWWGATHLTPVYAQAVLHYGQFGSGVIAMLLSLCGLISQPLVGTLSDHFGRRNVLLVSLFFGGLFLALVPLAGPHFFWIPLMLAGLAVLSTVPVVDALVADRVPVESRGIIYGVFVAIGISMGSLGPLVGGSVSDGYGFKAAFIVLGSFCWLAMIPLAILAIMRMRGK